MMIKKIEVKEFCENELAYLLDKNLKIDIKKFASERGKFLIVTLQSNIKAFEWEDTKTFKWEDIKDDFIPFIEFFNSKYGLLSIGDVEGLRDTKNSQLSFFTSTGMTNYSSYQVASDNFDFDFEIRGIRIYTKL